MKTRILQLFLFLLIALPMAGQSSLFPTPAALTLSGGEMKIGQQLSVKGNKGYAKDVARRIAREIENHGWNTADGRTRIRVELDRKAGLAAEAYRLEVNAEGIQLTASDEAGLWHAGEALLQMVETGNGTLACCRIDNAPRYQ